MPSLVITVNTDRDESIAELDTASPKEWCTKVQQLFKSINAGLIPASCQMLSDDTALVRASGTLTAASVAADDTCVINGVTLTGKASPSGESQFDSDGSNTVVAAAIAACINAHSSLTGIVYATSSAAVVTVYAYQAGLMGNAISLAGTATRLAASVSKLAGGTGAGETPVSYSLGK
jgi:phage tail sheath gpL-like